MTYNNPITIKADNNKRVNIGDPFVLKHDGIYYLYCSSEADELGVKCFSSTDMVNWKYVGAVTDELEMRNAFAPEVIYFQNAFYMIASPNGQGHYILKSHKPTGIFKLITGNLANMIDGSFFKEKGKLYVLRANHKGIALHSVTDDFKLVNRFNLEAEMNGWTEGPSLIKRLDKYYLTYCGNDLFSDAYRVNYSVSDNLFGPYVQADNNPLIIKTDRGYDALGHSSFIKGPDLDTYYNVYHKLYKDDFGSYRDLCLDRVDFLGNIIKQNVSSDSQSFPDRPFFESRSGEHQFNFDTLDSMYLSKCCFKNEVSIEFNFSGEIDLIFASKKETHYELQVRKNQISLLDVNHDISSLVLQVQHDMDLSCLNKLEIKNKDECHILINDEVVAKIALEDVSGKIGYRQQNKSYVGYIAASNIAYRSVNGPQTIPNLVFFEGESEFVDSRTSNAARCLVKGNGDFLVSAMIEVNTKSVIQLQIGNQKYQKNIDCNESGYEFNKENLGIYHIENQMEITMEIISGTATVQYLEFEKIANEKIISETTFDSHDEDIYLWNNSENYLNAYSLDFAIIKRNKHSRYGMIVNATKYSDFPYQAKLPYIGYFIGFYSNLLVVDKINYGIKRIYDIPFVTDKKDYKLTVNISGNKITVLVDDDVKIVCYDNLIKNTGHFGVFSDSLSFIKINNILGEYHDE